MAACPSGAPFQSGTLCTICTCIPCLHLSCPVSIHTLISLTVIMVDYDCCISVLVGAFFFNFSVSVI